MERRTAFIEYLPYDTPVIRDGNRHVLSPADVIHATDWDTKLILKPLQDTQYQGGKTWKEVAESLVRLKMEHYDVYGLIEQGDAIPDS